MLKLKTVWDILDNNGNRSVKSYMYILKPACTMHVKKTLKLKHVYVLWELVI